MCTRVWLRFRALAGHPFGGRPDRGDRSLEAITNGGARVVQAGDQRPPAAAPADHHSRAEPDQCGHTDREQGRAIALHPRAAVAIERLDAALDAAFDVVDDVFHLTFHLVTRSLHVKCTTPGPGPLPMARRSNLHGG